MKLQFLGHSCIKVSDFGFTLLVDPFISGNSKAPCTWQEAADGVTHILLTHGHSDHVGDSVAIAQQNSISVLAMVELAAWLGKKGVERTIAANFGGTITLGHDVKITLVPAWHSSSSDEGEYLGNPAGLIIQLGAHTIYHAGDTSIFGDMALINELYKPDIVLLPVGGTYTMDAKTAAFAAHKYFPQAKSVIPLHYATFPVLSPDASSFVDECKLMGVTPTVIEAGETIEF